MILLYSTYLFVLTSALLVFSTDGFIVATRGLQLTSKSASSWTNYPTKTLLMADLMNDDSDMPPVEEEEDAEPLKTTISKNSVKSQLRRGFVALSFAFDYSFFALCIVISSSLVLNIFGYDYQMREDGLVIDTIDHLRTYAQLMNQG